jgi:pimeloyl-ACP methyl ester carboxylesterase
MLRNGSLWRILQTSWPAFVALAAPAGLVVGLLTAALATVTLAAATWRAGHPGLSVGMAGVLLGGLLGSARWAQAKVQTAWLMRSASVILEQARGELPELESRMDAFAERLVDLAGAPDLDEVLLVGHSSGAMLAVSVMARALAKQPLLLEMRAPVALLTLGQCIPVLSYQPEADDFRGELARLRQAADLVWIDFTAPPDGCCFALMDPTEVCLDRRTGTRDLSSGGPKRLSPRFAKSFSPQRYQLIRRDKYRCHFQYLMATELPAAFDYFSVTAGALMLIDRFSAQPGVTAFRDFQCFGGPQR